MGCIAKDKQDDPEFSVDLVNDSALSRSKVITSIIMSVPNEQTVFGTSAFPY